MSSTKRSKIGKSKRKDATKKRLRTHALHAMGKEPQTFGAGVKAAAIMRPMSSHSKNKSMDITITDLWPLYVDGSKYNPGSGDKPGMAVLNCPAGGSSFTERIGRRIRMKSIQVRWSTTSWVPATKGPIYYTFALVYDKQADGAFPSVTDIFRDYDYTTTPSSNPLSGINQDWADRFVLLRRETFQYLDMAPNSTTVAIPGQRAQTSAPGVQDWYIKLGNLETQFRSDTGNDIGSIASGSLLLVAWCNVVAAGGFHDITGPLSFQFNSRLRYTSE